jgi:catechol 2,3-dioxygenase-like lactoylglutathione lyase family enzyme
MGFNHIALATRDLAGTHRFYTEAMGFRLAKAIAAPTPEGGWARHVFYDTGAGSTQLIAFWELHSDKIGDQFGTDLNKSLGLPAWVNHLAFDSPTLDDLEAAKQRWLASGLHVAHVDHGWCQSIYATDPNGIMVEFCCTTRELDATDETEALALISVDEPPLDDPPEATFFSPEKVITGA